MRVLVLFLIVIVLLLPIVSAQSIPGDSDGNGCVSFSEISVYVSQWLNGQVTLQQVSQAVNSWLQGCTPSTGSSLFSAAYPLTWPPIVINDGYRGAESNPTGNPIGGFYGYDRIVHPSQANYVVHNKDEFLAVLAQVQPGQIIYVDDNSVIDLYDMWNIKIPSNITIASGRGRNFSQGGLIRNLKQRINTVYDASRGVFLLVDGNHTRITGLRIEGPEKRRMWSRHSEIFSGFRPDLASATIYYMYAPTNGIMSVGSFNEYDNLEMYGWPSTAIYINTYNGNDYAPAENIWVHHNYIHHNAYAGLGYGISMPHYTGDTVKSSGLYEGNLFNRNRHSIASGGQNWSNFEARYNIVLEDETSHAFDRHPNSGPNTGGVWGGDWTIIHHNTGKYYGFSGTTIGIRGQPYLPNGTQIYNNWFYQGLAGAIFYVYLNGTPTYVHNAVPNTLTYNNYGGIIPPPETHLPVAVLTMDRDIIHQGDTVSFSADKSYKQNGAINYVCYDYGDRSPEDCGFVNDIKTHTFPDVGRYVVTLKAVDEKGVFDIDRKAVEVNPSNPNAVILTFWQKDTYGIHSDWSTSSGYFKKRLLINNVTVWERDINADGTEWEKITIDITSYVDDVSVVDFQIQSLQNYSSPLYPEAHKFEHFEVYLDNIYVSGMDYSTDGFGDWENTALGPDNSYILDGTVAYGKGATYFYKVGDPWWRGETSNEHDQFGGKRVFVFDSLFRQNSTAGSVRGIRQKIYAPKDDVYLSIVDSAGWLIDRSDYNVPFSFEGIVNADDNNLVDFYGRSKLLNGVNNYLRIPTFDLSRDYVLDMDLFIPYKNREATLMYASGGAGYVHIYYSPTEKIMINNNGVVMSCSLPKLSHTYFNRIVIGRSCSGSTCVLSCANNGVINEFSIPSATLTLSGMSSVSFGGHAGGSSNMYGALHNVRIIKGPISRESFINESKSKLQGAWYFRDAINGVVQDGSPYNVDVAIPSDIVFASEGNRRFMQIEESGSQITIPRNSSFAVGRESSVELIGRFNVTSYNHIIIDGLPWAITNRKYTPGYEDGGRIYQIFNLDVPGSYGDSQNTGYGVKPTHELTDEQWHHYVFTRYDNHLRVYVDGVLERHVYVPDLPINTTVADITINAPSYRHNIWIGSKFNGKIQRLSIFDKTLTTSDVESMYSSSLNSCSDADSDGFGVFPRSGVVNGCRFDGFDCNDGNAGVGAGVC